MNIFSSIPPTLPKNAALDVGLSIFNFYDRQNVWYREYDFTQAPPVISEVRYLGLTPNLSVDLKF